MPAGFGGVRRRTVTSYGWLPDLRVNMSADQSAGIDATSGVQRVRRIGWESGLLSSEGFTFSGVTPAPLEVVSGKKFVRYPDAATNSIFVSNPAVLLSDLGFTVSVCRFYVACAFVPFAFGGNALSGFNTNPGLVADANGFWGVHLGTGGTVQVGLNNGGTQSGHEMPVPANELSVMVASYGLEGATTVTMRTDRLSFTTATAANPTTVNGALRYGRNFNGSSFANARLGRLVIGGTPLDRASMDALAATLCDEFNIPFVR